jgi:hypothetical protein
VVIKSWEHFLLESILYTSNDFKKILSSIKDDIVASDLLSLINKDIKTNYNILKTTDKNDTIGFISDNQATTKLKSMNLIAVFLSNSNKTTIGRIAKSILSDNGLKKSDKEIEIFVNRFKAAYDSLNTPKDKIRIVKEEDIRYWYLSDRYSMKSKGTLRNSCMRYEEAQDYLNIYVKNPSVCQLVIKVDDDEKLEARALLWQTDKGPYLDRIYYTDDSDETLLETWFRERFTNGLIYNEGIKKIEIQLENWTTNPRNELYPYMDSLPYYYATENKLFSYPVDVKDKKNLFYIQETDGSHQPQDMVYCEYEDESHPSDEVVYSDYHYFHLRSDNAIWSKRVNSYIPRNWANYSKVLDDYLPQNKSVYVYLDLNGNGDYFPDDESDKYNFTYEVTTGEYHDKSLLIKYGDEYYLKNNVVLTYSISEEDYEKYYQIYNNKRYFTTKLDEEVFGFKLNEDEEEIVTKKDYYHHIYKKVIYKKFLDNLMSLKGKVNESKLQQKIEELNEANEIMSKSNFYLYNNFIYDKYENLNNLLDFYKKMFTHDKFMEIIQKSMGRWWFSDFNNTEDNRNVLYKLCLDPLNFYRITDRNKSMEKYKEIKGSDEDFANMTNLSYRFVNDFIYILETEGYKMEAQTLYSVLENKREYL